MRGPSSIGGGPCTPERERTAPRHRRRPAPSRLLSISSHADADFAFLLSPSHRRYVSSFLVPWEGSSSLRYLQC